MLLSVWLRAWLEVAICFLPVACVFLQCNSGSALHEAALCGKDETVRLLLDKGIDTKLKNKDNKTVLEVLSEYPAEQSRRIQSIIRDHVSYLQYRPKTRYMKPRSHRLFAMAICDRARENHVGRDSLHYKKGTLNWTTATMRYSGQLCGGRLLRTLWGADLGEQMTSLWLEILTVKGYFAEREADCIMHLHGRPSMAIPSFDGCYELGIRLQIIKGQTRIPRLSSTPL